MSKNAAIKVLILLVVVALVYSVFWFFKVGQLEKQVRNFIDENSAYISSGSVAVSGFPLAQKLTIKDLSFSVPTPFLAENKVVVKSLEAKADMFSTKFSVTISKEISLQDIQGNTMAVEMNSDPEVSFTITEGRLANFNYTDAGYRILDAEKKAVYTAASSSFTFSSSTEAGDKISNKLAVDIKDIQGFDLGDFYKNAFEKKVVEGIKTGEITLGNNTSVAVVDPAAANAATSATPAIPTAADTTAAATPAVPAAPATPTAPATTEAAVAPADATKDLSAAVSNDLVKNNFKMEIEYILTPNKTEQQSQAPSDPTQIQELPVQYTKTVKFSSFEFSNPLYKITLNGELTFANDDNLPYGSLSFMVDKVDNLISYVSSYINKIVEDKKSAASTDSTDAAPADVAAQPADVTAPVAAVSNEALTDNSYPDFLNKISLGLMSVTKEIAAKNLVTKDDIAQFDLRREKNLEFVINETPSREILGKF